MKILKVLSIVLTAIGPIAAFAQQATTASEQLDHLTGKWVLKGAKTQIYTAVITYTVVAIIKEKLKLKQSPYEILQIMSVSLLDKTHLPILFKNPIYQDVKEQNYIQLKINLI